MAVRVDAGAARAEEAVASGERSLRSFVDRLAVLELPSSAWLRLDPEALTLADIDTPADLERLRRVQAPDGRRS
jgi:molybdopterin-guanine dinucleotide biosynthesis protein A